MNYIKFFVVLVGYVFSLNSVNAEPWISVRYAQNCAACHSPGRWNLKPSERRCTLSCQGCHVNPNGGGIRNQYGVWNQQRWLRSFYSETLRNKRTPAPLKHQPYAATLSSVNEDVEAKSKSKSKKSKSKSRKPNQLAKGEIPELLVTTSLAPSNSDYDRTDYQEWKTDVEKDKFLTTIPTDDPYRLERSEWLYGGGDIRYNFGSFTEDGEKTELSFPMAVDFGFRFRPIKEKLSFVLEHRYFNTPSNKNIENAFTTTSQVRSAYVIGDDLWYNTWVMAGLYKPMFGNYIPDHTSLSQEIPFGSTSFTTLYKAVGFGGSPNVPYANIHMITPMADEEYSQDNGFVVNLGARAVTKSLSGNLSYWSTNNKSSGETLSKQMIAVSGGMMLDPLNLGFMKLGPTILGGEWIRVDEEFQVGKKNGGNVVSLDAKIKFWREMYITTRYAYANVARTPRLNEGKSSEFMLGIKTFLYSGIEVEASFMSRPNETIDSKSEEKISLLQAHLFF